MVMPIQSTRDLICGGVDAGLIDCLPHSALQDPDIIRSILKDTLDVRSLYYTQFWTSYQLQIGRRTIS